MKRRFGAPANRGPAEPPTAPVPRGWFVAVGALAAVLVVLAVSFRMDDPDLWQHLAVGRAMWQLHAVPHVDLWTWPGYGQSYFLPSWLFRALLWPFWAAGGEWGGALLRWGLTLGTFAALWLAARRAGARGLAPFIVLVWCAMVYRRRSMLRPEMLGGLMLALEIWVLESRRAGDRRAAWWLVPIAMVWANANVSFVMFFEVGAAWLADAFFRRREGGAPGRLAVVLAVALAACFVNPFGWRALWEPFDFLLFQRNEPIFRVVEELSTIPWADTLRSGLPLLMLLAPLLALARWRRKPDVAQALIYVAFYAQALQSARFLGPFSIAIAPFLARDLSDGLAARRWPDWARPPAARATLAAALCVAVALPELLRPTTPFGVGIRTSGLPVAACDWIERHDVHGRLWNSFDDAGYLLWRFWPRRDRLPFMDIHQTGTRRDRDLMAAFYTDPRAWTELDRERRFDWVLVRRTPGPHPHRVDVIAADSAFVPGFIDDEWVVLLRRDGSMAALAESLGYRWLPASYLQMQALGAAFEADSTLRRRLRVELERSVHDSPRTGHSRSLLANLDLLEGDWTGALEELRAARALDPELPGLDERERMARDSLEARNRGEKTR